DCLERRLDAGHSDSVRQLARAAGVTLANVSQAAWALLLSHYSRSSDIVFGIARSCRPSGPPGSEDAAGAFLNVLPLRVKVERGCNVLELLWNVRDQVLAIRDHHCANLEAVAQCTGHGNAASLVETVLECEQRDPM